MLYPLQRIVEWKFWYVLALVSFVVFQRLVVRTWFHLRMRGSNEKMTRSSSVVTRHDRRGSCVVMTADGPASSPTAAKVWLGDGCTPMRYQCIDISWVTSRYSQLWYRFTQVWHYIYCYYWSIFNCCRWKFSNILAWKTIVLIWMYTLLWLYFQHICECCRIQSEYRRRQRSSSYSPKFLGELWR